MRFAGRSRVKGRDGWRSNGRNGWPPLSTRIISELWKSLICWRRSEKSGEVILAGFFAPRASSIRSALIGQAGTLPKQLLRIRAIHTFQINPLPVLKQRGKMPEILETENRHEKFYFRKNPSRRRRLAAARGLQIAPAHQRRAASGDGGQRQCRTTRSGTAGKPERCHTRMSRRAAIVVFHSRPLGLARPMGLGTRPLASATASGRHLDSG